MSRPGWLVAAEQKARDEAILRDWADISDGRDELAEVAPEIECDGCAACRAIARERGMSEPQEQHRIEDTCCGACPGDTCYVDQVTGA